MTPAAILAFATPISEEEPCGPDLDMLGDADYMRFVARIDSVLPKSFASFDRASIDFPAEFATIQKILGQSRDLRILTYLAKLEILNRDLAAFVAVVQTIEKLLDAMWERVIPELLDGDPILRVVSVQTLDDMPDSVMPLQSTPLFEARRFGKVSYRAHLLASGALQARTAAVEGEKDEEKPSNDAIQTALVETDIEQLIASRTLTIDLDASLERIETTLADKSGQPGVVRFEKLRPLAKDIALFLDGAVAQRDPARAILQAKEAREEVGDDDEPTGPVGVIRTLTDANAALAAAAGYFMRSEPSSPILSLIAQAEALIGKSFFDALQALMPDNSGRAFIKIGRETFYELSIERLSSLSVTTSELPEEPAPTEEYSDWSEQPAEDSPPEEAEAASDETAGEETPGEEAPADGETPAEATDESAYEEAPAEPIEDPEPSYAEHADAAPAVSAAAHTPMVFKAVTRKDAMTMLSQIAAYFRSVEPSSPVPTLLEHAASLSGRDFFALVREVLPAQLFKVDE
ncbi:ImpA family type VI secretion system protein [Terrarubrum flagellatum]|uniref:type VI secretion system protein TssA n=1 Tax=Terrirubrum flagellatum TaxID=2895980 RepID=UPI0031450F58